MTWEKLCLELNLLKSESPRSLIPLLVGVNAVLRADDSLDWCGRSISFLAFEVCATAKEQSDTERLKCLNEFFFKGKEFQITSLNVGDLHIDHLLLRRVIEERRGAMLPIACLYTHLAEQLNLAVSIVNVTHHHLLRWTHGAQTDFIDLSQNGLVLNEEQMLQLVQQNPQASDNARSIDIMTKYLFDLTRHFRRTNEQDLEHAIWSMLLQLEPNSLTYLKERAFIRKSLGHLPEALADIKRYYSFSDPTQIPEDVRRLNAELISLQNLSKSNALLH